MRKKKNPFEETLEVDVQQQAAAGSGDDESRTEDSGDEEFTQVGEALAAAERELDLHREAMLRMQAETDNTRKRLNRDLEKSRRFALERIMKDLLQVLDSMERGLETDMQSATIESMLEGQALTLKMLNKVLQDHDLELIDPKGESFNPEFHEAVTMLPSAEHEEGSVMEVLQKGYKLHDRLIRPAMVVVSRKP